MTTDNLFEEKVGISIEDYQRFTPSTMVVDIIKRVDYLERGLVAEVGELIGAVAKYYRDDYDIEEMNSRVRKELGDVMYFISEYANHMEWDLRVIMEENMHKLQDRLKRNVIKGDGDDR